MSGIGSIGAITPYEGIFGLPDRGGASVYSAGIGNGGEAAGAGAIRRDAFGKPLEDEREDIALPGGKDPEEERKERLGIQDPGEECQTCKNRKYKDGSNEMVSFKSPKHLSPESAGAAVRAHEREHVSNAYAKAATGNGRVISASVSIHTAVCPECGRTYVSGGTTHTQIKYYNEDNPYQKELKSADRARYVGMNLDKAV